MSAAQSFNAAAYRDGGLVVATVAVDIAFARDVTGPAPMTSSRERDERDSEVAPWWGGMSGTFAAEQELSKESQ